MTGQVLDNIYFSFIKNQYIFMEVLIPDKNSLSKKYANKYTKESYKKLKSVGLSQPKIKILGEEPQGYNKCECKKVKEYILYTTYVQIKPALRCKKRFGYIPLYKLPPIYDNADYYPLITWKSDYQSCDSLQMNCSVGEKLGMKEMTKHNSDLSKDGRDVCKEIAKVTGKKTFYYLYNYEKSSLNKELKRKCPKCNSKWLRKKSLHKLFDFECKKCKLLSNISFDVRWEREG
jgi:predicted  nucleic acid-binding Zn ribbon protein